MPKILCYSPSLKFNLLNSARREAGSFLYIMLVGDSNTELFSRILSLSASPHCTRVSFAGNNLLLITNTHRRSLGGAGGGGTAPPRSEPIDFVRSMNTKIFSHCLILFALLYFNEYVKA